MSLANRVIQACISVNCLEGTPGQSTREELVAVLRELAIEAQSEAAKSEEKPS